MADVKWIKLSTNMFEDEKIRLIEALPDADTILIIWVKLLAQAGKTNATGYIFLNENIPYTDEMLSTIFNRPIGTVRLALKTFQQFGMIEINEDHFISISNWEKHQNIEGMERIREQTRQRVAKHRQAKTYVTLPVTDGNATDIEEDIDKEEDKKEIKDKKPSRPKRVYDEQSIHYRLSLRLYENILVNNPEYKKPNLQNWANDVRLMMEQDNRTEEQIHYLMDWCQNDSFWKSNILSISKLREKFDQLVIRVKEDINKKNQSGKKGMPKAYQSLKDWADEE